MYDTRKRLIILLSILGVLVLGAIGGSIIYGYTLMKEQQYAQERAEAAQYIADTDHWVELNDIQSAGSIAYIDNIGSMEKKNAAFMLDSDGDGYPDAYEVLAGSDPNKKETFTKANAKSLKLECEQAQLELNGTPAISAAEVSVNQFNKSRSAAFATKIYEVSYPQSEEIYSITLTLHFNPPEGQSASDAVINKIYPNGTLEPVETKVDAAAETASCTPESGSSYVVVFEALSKNKLNSVPAVVLSIDDSGSMYYYNGDEDCNNDPDLLRYDLCLDIIAAAGKNSTIAMNYFAGTVEEGFGFGTKASQMKGFIQDLKKVPESEKNFTGTCLGSALEKSVNDLLLLDNPSRFVICLTDGESTEGYEMWNAAVKKCRDENITLIVIGLGDEVNIERLSADAVSTGGYYLNAKDAGCIETITDSLLAVIKNKGVQVLNIVDREDNSTLVNTYLVADSGFDINKHAMVYEDYHVVSSVSGNPVEIGTQSAGIAEFTREWFTGTLRASMTAANSSLASDYCKDVLSAEDKKTFLIPMMDYVLSDTAANTDLCEKEIPSLKAMAEYYNIINDYVNSGVNMHAENGCLVVNDDKIPQYIKNNPDRFYKAFVDLADPQYYTDAAHDKLEFTQICVYYPNLDFYANNDLKDDPDYLIKVIYTMFTQQLSSKMEVQYFDTPEREAHNSVGNAAIIADITSKLQLGDPCVLAYDTTGSSEAGRADRAVNAAALYRSCENSHIYYLKCSDSALKGRYIYFMIDATDPQGYVITDMWRSQQTYYLGTQTIN